jgi:Tfp pilus assembly protein PilF
MTDRIEKIKAMLLENPEDNFLSHALALEYCKLGDDTTARQLFERILQRDPGYVGTYYHLAKLLERMQHTNDAINVYQQGMQQALKTGDRHAYNELRSAYEELTF